MAAGAEAKVPYDPQATVQSGQGGDAVAAAAANAASAAQSSGGATQAQTKAVLAMIAAEGGFLLDARAKEHVQTLPEDEQLLYRVDAVLAALGVEDKDDLDELVVHFFDAPGSDKMKHANDVVKTLIDFIALRQQSLSSSTAPGAAAAAPAAAAGGKGDAGAAAGGAESVAAELSEKRQRKQDRERTFWRKLANALDGSRFRVWEALAVGLKRYTTVLDQRARVIDETTALARQNEELKILLQEYLGSKINAELHVPPTRLIRVDPSSQGVR